LAHIDEGLKGWITAISGNQGGIGTKPYGAKRPSWCAEWFEDANPPCDIVHA
jgi:hypothetical protein